MGCVCLLHVPSQTLKSGWTPPPSLPVPHQLSRCTCFLLKQPPKTQLPKDDTTQRTVMQSHIETELPPSSSLHGVRFMLSIAVFPPKVWHIQRHPCGVCCGVLGCLGTQFENRRVGLEWEDITWSWNWPRGTGWPSGSEQFWVSCHSLSIQQLADELWWWGCSSAPAWVNSGVCKI